MSRKQIPSTNGGNGERDERGRFVAGNSGGPGNPYAAKVAKLRSAMLDAVTTEDMKKIVEKLKDEALTGNVQAIKEILDRTLGRPVEADLIERLEELEAVVEAKARGVGR